MRHISILIYITAVILTGCSKGLDLYPLDSISDATFWQSASEFKLAANNLYSSLSQHDLDGDLESDIAYQYGNAISNGTYVVSETDSKWSTPYQYIRRCNKIINEATNSNVANDAGVKRFVAEAKFFRAWNYWMLFRLFGGVPVVNEVLDINSEALYSPRSSRKETVDFILQDLTDAETDLPSASSLLAEDVGRITKGAAVALKARIALFEGTWGKYHGNADVNTYLNNAVESANAVVGSDEYSLYKGSGDNSYRYLFIEQGDDSPESILDDRYEVNIRGQEMSYYLMENGYLATKALADSYLCSDGLPIEQSQLFEGYDTRTSEYQNRDPRMTMTLVLPGESVTWMLFPEPIESWPFFPQRNGNTGYITNKYRSEDKFGNATQQSQYGFDTHLIRYAEVLLIYAEALFERDGEISDADLNKSINALRDRVGMPHLTNSFVSSNGLDMKQEIRRERTIELALEGYRYDDLRRWKIAETELPKAIKGIKIIGTQWGTEPIIINGVDKNLYMKPEYQAQTDEDGFLIAEPDGARSFDTGKHYLRPIPTREIMINDKLEQNPVW